MSISIRMHFDGKVFVPDQQVDLPVDQPLEFELRQTPETLQWNPERAKEAIRWLTDHAVSGLNIPDEALRRESMYEDRGL